MPCHSQLATFLGDSQLTTPIHIIILSPTLIDNQLVIQRWQTSNIIFSLETTLHPWFLHHHFLGFNTTAAFNLQPIQVTSNSPSHGWSAPYLADLNHPSKRLAQDAGCMAPIAGIQPCQNSTSSMWIQWQRRIADSLLTYLLTFQTKASVPLQWLEHLSLYGKGFLWCGDVWECECLYVAFS